MDLEGYGRPGLQQALSCFRWLLAVVEIRALTLLHYFLS